MRGRERETKITLSPPERFSLHDGHLCEVGVDMHEFWDIRESYRYVRALRR